jgi:hypothetical protein
LQDAQSSLKGEEVEIDGQAAMLSMEKLADQEEEIKGKQVKGQLPSAIQSMAQLLNSAAAQRAKPTEREGKSQYGAQAPQAAPAKEEQPDGSAPAFGVIATHKR